LLGYTKDKGTFTNLGLKLVYGDGLIVASYDDTKKKNRNNCIKR
jgi:hypothetical protein